MKRSIITTNDGSKTIKIEDWNEYYHSTHGAVQEAEHVYIKAGLAYFNLQHQPQSVNVLEAGFGTGLNALLTCLWSENMDVHVSYTGLEAYPITSEEREAMDYAGVIVQDSAQKIYHQLHSIEWETTHELSS